MGQRFYVLACAGLTLVTALTLALLVALAPSGLPPHSVCWRRSPGLIALHLAGDLMVWAAYVVIPLMFVYLLVAGRLSHTSQLSFPSLVVWGALFVWCCGETHLLDALEIGRGIQWQRGIMKVLTGVVSFIFVGKLLRQRQELLAVARALYRAVEEEAQARR